MRIRFTRLQNEHLCWLLKWLETPHVKQWWDQDIEYTSALVDENFGKYIYKDDDSNQHDTYAYIIYINDTPVGYIQLYQVDESVRNTFSRINIPKKLVGCDLFIGDERFIGKGLGEQILAKFLESFVEPHYDACLVDPDSNNARAIAVYKKAGFIQLEQQDDSSVTWMLRKSKQDKVTQLLNELSKEINELYGHVKVEGENIEEPAINVGPCGPFAFAFYQAWNKRFNQKVSIAFIMVKNSDECWHVLVRLPNEMLFDGGFGVHDEQKYKDKFIIEDMKNFDLALLDEKSHSLEREYPRYCPKFSLAEVTALIEKHLDKLKYHV